MTPTPEAPPKAHVFSCYVCKTSNDACLKLALGETCCRRCNTTAGATHSRQLLGSQWVALTGLPTK